MSMAFDLPRIEKELAAAPLLSPYPRDLAVAVVNDRLRLAGQRPVPPAQWRAWAQQAGPRWPEQLGVLAHLLAATCLGAETVATLRGGLDPAALPAFFQAVEPLTGELVRDNPFRREELVRRWIEAIHGRVAGESPKESARRLEQLDYRRTLAEYDRADKARLAEAKRRVEILAEAERKRQAEASQWRE